MKNKNEKTQPPPPGITLIEGALLAVSVVILQDIITIGNLDLHLWICIYSLAVGMPFLAGSFVLNFDDQHYGWSVKTKLSTILSFVGFVATLLGIGAAFAHISLWVGIVGVASLGIVALFYRIYTSKNIKILEKEIQKKKKETQEFEKITQESNKKIAELQNEQIQLERNQKVLEKEENRESQISDTKRRIFTSAFYSVVSTCLLFITGAIIVQTWHSFRKNPKD